MFIVTIEDVAMLVLLGIGLILFIIGIIIELFRGVFGKDDNEEENK